jgi:hypothetical protein
MGCFIVKIFTSAKHKPIVYNTRKILAKSFDFFPLRFVLASLLMQAPLNFLQSYDFIKQ